MGLIRDVRNEGLAVVCIEHVMRALTALADRVLVMHHGATFFEGTPQEMLANERVIEVYLGSTHRGSRDPGSGALILDVRGLVAGYGDSIVVRDLDLSVRGWRDGRHDRTERTWEDHLPACRERTDQADERRDLVRRGACRRKEPRVHRGDGFGARDAGDGLFADMTVEENLLMGAFPASKWNTRHHSLEGVYALFPQLKERRGQRARTLSGGERRLVGLGRGLMREARLLLIDEPSLGLAPVIIETVYGAIREIRESLNTTILLIEENFTHIGGVADVVHIVEMGGIVRSGSLEELSSDRTVVETYLGAL